MKTLLALFIGMFNLAAVAQGAYKCDDNYKVFEGRFLARQYEDAYKVLNELRIKCPKVNENLYVNGAIVLKYMVEVSSEEEQKAFVNDLVALYNEQSINFPDSGAGVKKTMLQLDNKLITQEEAYKSLNSLFDKYKFAFDDYNSLYTYYGMVQEDYNRKSISDEQYFEKYALISSQVTAARNTIAQKKEALTKKQETGTLTDLEKEFVIESEGMLDALENVEHIIQKQSKSIVSCEKLEEYYAKNFETHKTDFLWVESMTDALYVKKCFKSELLLKGLQLLHQVKPSKNTAYRLGMLALKKKGKTSEAVTYFEQAASYESNPVAKSDIYFELGNALQNTDKGAAKKYILQSAQLNPKEAKGYILLAEMYATALPTEDCKLNDFDRKVLNYLALDVLKKAEAAEPKYKATVAASRAKYEKNLPTKDMAKAMKKGKGDKITFGCWINETVTLPKL